ncbi:MAG: alpha/beta hydrolase family protein [Lysobacteraceae bacterium]
METTEFSAADGRVLHGEWIPAAGTSRRTIVMHSATGVPRGFYRAFATELAARGADVLLWDPRGVGDSALRPVRRDPATMLDWGRLDQAAALAHAGQRAPHRPIAIVGHSAGGHLTGLNAGTVDVDALVLIAAGGCDWRDYPRGQWPRLFFAWYAALPLLLGVFGHLPAWAGIGQPLPRGVIRDWRRWSLRRGYLFTDDTLDRSAYARYAGPLLMLSVSDDRDYAPPRAVRSLLAQFTTARAEHRELDAHTGHRGRIGHFGFFRRDNAPLWRHVTDWLDALPA